jgi:hypothetical protein
LLEPHADLVKELVAEQPDSTLAELQVRLAKEKKDDLEHLLAMDFERAVTLSFGHEADFP